VQEKIAKTNKNVCQSGQNSCVPLGLLRIMTASLDKLPLLGNRVSARQRACCGRGADTERGRGGELVVCGESAIKVLTTNGKPAAPPLATASITVLPSQTGTCRLAAQTK